VREVGAGATSVKVGDHVIPALHARVPEGPNLPVAAVEPLHGDPRDSRPGIDAGRRVEVLLRRRRRAPLHGLLDHLELHGVARDNRRESPRGRAFREDLLHQLRRHDGVGTVVHTTKVCRARTSPCSDSAGSVST
jgi:hypothetical protein